MIVAILTQPLIGNYGGFLQNYALHTILKRLGHKPITIDYFQSAKFSRFVLSTIKTILLWPFPKLRRGFLPLHSGRHIIKNQNFVKNHITVSRPVYKYRKSIIKEYGIEAVITGSDQVWRPTYNPHLKDLYLDFVRGYDIPKIAYAASFGTSETEYSDTNIKDCVKAARELDYVSVREYSGVDLCKRYFDIHAVCTLDPTLLLTEGDYCNLAQGIQKQSENYIFVYGLDNNDILSAFAKKISEKLRIEQVIMVTQNMLSVSPDEWVALIRDSKFVITDSFHGTIFSIIFKKNFLTLVNNERGQDRFYSLLNMLNLQNRIINTEKGIEKIFAEPIDWEKIEKILSSERSISIEFISRALGNRR